MRGWPSPRRPLSPQWALRGFGLKPYKLPRARLAPFPCLSLEYHPNPKSNCCQCSCPNVFENGQSPSWLTVASLMLLLPQCGFIPGGLASQLPLPVRNTPASKAFLTPRKRNPPPQPLSDSLQLRRQGLGSTSLPRQADNTLHQAFCSLQAFGQKALASWQPSASTGNVPGS